MAHVPWDPKPQGNLAAHFGPGGFRVLDEPPAEPPELAFSRVLAEQGLEAENVVADGDLRRCRAEGDKGRKRSGWYVLHLCGDFAAGAYGDWRSDLKATWCSHGDHELDVTQRAQRDAALEAARQLRDAEAEKRHERARTDAAQALKDAAVATDAHPYLARKGVQAYGLHTDAEGRLLVPMVDIDGELWSLQRIWEDGTKRYLAGGRVRGCHFLIGEPARLIYIAEGYATAATVHEATGQCVAVAFDAGNLRAVAEALRAKYPAIQIVIAADNDRHTQGNPGLTKGRTAADAVGGRCIAPSFTTDTGTDWNDLANGEGGLKAVREQLEGAKATQRSLLVDLSEFISHAEPPNYIIYGLKEANTLCCEFGEPGSGKSFRLIDEACRIALGISLHGRATKPGPVVYVVGEGHGGLQRRFLAWQQHYQQLFRPGMLRLTRTAVPIMDEAEIRRLRGEIEAFADEAGMAPLAIYVDTLTANFGAGDPDKTADMARFITLIGEHLREPFGAHVVVTHHPGHQDKSRPRNASALGGAADMLFRIENVGGVIRMVCTKAKDAEIPKPLIYQLDTVVLDIRGEIVTSAVAVQADGAVPEEGKTEPGSDAQRVALELLQGMVREREEKAEEAGTGYQRVRRDEWREKAIEEAMTPSSDAFKHTVSKLIKRGLVIESEGFVWPA